MKVNLASNILKVLLVLFANLAVFIGVFIMPLLAGEMLALYPELEYVKLPLLISTELLLVLLLIGIGIMMYLLIVFDRGHTFSSKFVKGLEILVGMCIVVSIGIISLFLYMNSFGGPGPMISLIMVSTTVIIWIVAAVMMLIRAIVRKAMVYKDDYDLTV